MREWGLGFAQNDDFIVGALGLMERWRVVINSISMCRYDGNLKHVNVWGFILEYIICVLDYNLGNRKC